MRLSKTASSVVGTVSGLLSAPALADGLPQLDSSRFSPQLVWLAISFAVLYYLMLRMVLPRIAQVLDDRQHKIDENLRRADNLRREAQTASAAYEKTMSEARAAAQQVIREAQDRLAKIAAERHAETMARLQADIEAAEGRIGQARATAIAGMRDLASGVAKSAAERLIGEPLDDTVVGSAVDEIMRERT